MDKDEEYEDMVKQQKAGKLELKKNGYRYQKLKCCYTCKNSRQSCCENPITCYLASHFKWLSGEVDMHGICNKYEEIKYNEK